MSGERGALEAGSPGGSQLVVGLRLLRDAALLMIVSTLTIGIGMVTWMFGMWATSVVVMPGVQPEHLMHFPGFVGLGMIVLSIVAILGAIVGLYALFAKLIPATEEFTRYSPEFSTSATLVKVGYAGGLILLLVGFATLTMFIGVFMVIAAAVLLLIGSVGLAILSLKLHEKLNSSTFLVAAILFLVGIFVPIVYFVAWILVYIEANTLIGKLTVGA